MDKELIDKLNSVSDWVKLEDKKEVADNVISFQDKENGLISIRGPKGVVAHKLKPLADLFAPSKVTPLQINWEDDRYIPLFYAIENTIKRVYSMNPELTDSAVILVLDQVSTKTRSGLE
jgi:hypothetical protein